MNKQTLDVAEVKPPLKKMLAEIISVGEEILIMDGDKLLARIVPAGKRIAGLHPGSFWMADDFNAPLLDEFWTGSDESPL